MHEVTATEARARWAELLRRVERGETVAIARHDETVAHMVPAERGPVVDCFRQRRSSWKPAGMSTGEILDARHRDHRLRAISPSTPPSPSPGPRARKTIRPPLSNRIEG